MITRRQFVASSLAACGAMGSLAPPANAAAEFRLKLGHSLPTLHSLNVRVKEAAETISRESNGRVDLQVFANSQLGSDPQLFSQVRAGAIDMCFTTVLYVDSSIPDVSASGLAYAFKDYSQVWAAWDGKFGDHIRNLFEPIGVSVVGKTWDNGFRHITNNVRPVTTPDDLRGMKIRVPVEKVLVSLFEHLGAAPTAMSVKEVYSALQTHVVDGQDNALTHVEFWKFFEVQKYLSITNHMWDGFWIFANPKNLAKLPGNLRDLVTTSLDAAAVKQRADMQDLNGKLETVLRERGMTVNAAHPEKFRERLRKTDYYGEWRKTLSPAVWSLLEQFTGAIG
jgi:tripartite ATP-independent transporter DctP family solute receptor